METSTTAIITIHQRIGAALAAIAIGLGAFGAHGLESRLEAAGMMEVWRTAVFYHLIHAVCIYFLAWNEAFARIEPGHESLDRGSGSIFRISLRIGTD